MADENTTGQGNQPEMALKPETTHQQDASTVSPATNTAPAPGGYQGGGGQVVVVDVAAPAAVAAVAVAAPAAIVAGETAVAVATIAVVVAPAAMTAAKS